MLTVRPYSQRETPFGGHPLWTLSPVHSVIDSHPKKLAVSVETACPGEPANAQTARDGGAAECTFFLGNAAEVLVPEPTGAGIVPASHLQENQTRLMASLGRVAHVQKTTFTSNIS